MTTCNDKAAVRQLHDEVITALNALDLDKLLSLHTDNIILMEPNMPTITGKAELMQLFKKFQQQKLVYKLSYSIDELEVFGQRAFVRGQVLKQITQNDQSPVMETGKFITLSQKQDDGRWLRTHVMVNNDDECRRAS